MFNKNINMIYILFVLGFASIANCADLRCYNGSFDDYVVISLDEPESLLNETCYDADRDTVFYVFGFTEYANGSSSNSIVDAYLDLGTYNVLLLNWEEENRGIFGTLSYFSAAVPNAKKVGDAFGEALVKLDEAGLSLSTVELIGFSLGAQVVACAGRKVQDLSEKNVSRILGLDPAGPAFEGIASLPALEASNADTVYAIHTNPGLLGTYESKATVDIWPNCGSSIQPACEDNSTLADQMSCSHNAVWKYLIEALARPQAFVARSASSCSQWKTGSSTNDTLYFGENFNTTAQGLYFLRTNDVSLFGLGDEGSQPASD